MPHSLTFREFYCGRLSSAQLDRWQALKQWPIINQRPVEQMAFQRDQRPCDNGYKSIFTNSWLVHQRHRSWIKGFIRQTSTKRVNLFLQCGHLLFSGPHLVCHTKSYTHNNGQKSRKEAEINNVQ